MLTNMFIGDPPGTTDRILDYSTAVTGGLFFIPPAGLLEDLTSVGASDVTEAPLTLPAADPDLGIGSLREQV